jgi:hypothetical protein
MTIEIALTLCIVAAALALLNAENGSAWGQIT